MHCKNEHNCNAGFGIGYNTERIAHVIGITKLDIITKIFIKNTGV